MSTAVERIKVFRDTLDWINEDKDLSGAVDWSKKHTKVYFEDDYPEINREETNTRISVTKSRSFEAAMRLQKENPGKKIAVMNFANSIHPGGGVVNGASAQEECLCRTSTLYPCLDRKYLRDTYYKHHKTLNTPMASDALIYTEGVVICKTDEDLPKRLPKEDWLKVDVITIAAPDLRSKSNIHFDLVGGGTTATDAELYGYHIKRAIHMLTVAASKDVDILVLGAFGCGAFENPPEVVARAFKDAINVFPSYFDMIEFAVYCSPRDMANYDVFSRVMIEVG